MSSARYAKIAAKANDALDKPRVHLTASSDRMELLEWCAFVDPNGEWGNIIWCLLGGKPFTKGGRTYELDCSDVEIPTVAELWDQIEDMVRSF